MDEQVEATAQMDATALSSRVVAWLRANLPGQWVAAIDAGDAEALSEARKVLDLGAWWARLADARLVTPTWPTEHGGLGLPPALGAYLP